MPCPTLIVIDMQPDFKAAGKPNVIAGVAREILNTKMQNGSIIFLEYKGCLPTYTALLNLTRGYANKVRVRKPFDDGSDEVIRCLLRRSYETGTLRVCGVNAHACVCATVDGLLNKLEDSKIEVVKDACDWAKKTKFNWRNFFRLRHRNLRLV